MQHRFLQLTCRPYHVLGDAVQASIAANTYVISGPSQSKSEPLLNRSSVLLVQCLRRRA